MVFSNLTEFGTATVYLLGLELHVVASRNLKSWSFVYISSRKQIRPNCTMSMQDALVNTSVPQPCI